MSVLLFTQAEPGAKWKCPRFRDWTDRPLFRVEEYTRTLDAHRWALVECGSAADGRFVLATARGFATAHHADGSFMGRIIAEGGRK